MSEGCPGSPGACLLSILQQVKSNSMQHFNKLDWYANPNIFGARVAHVFFPNGYGASIAQGVNYNPESYEVAVLRGDEAEAELCYDTVITDDVIGNLEPWEVERLIAEIAALPQAPEGPVVTMRDLAEQALAQLQG